LQKELVSKVDNYESVCRAGARLGRRSATDPATLGGVGGALSKFELQEASLHKIFIDLVGPDAARAEARPDA